MFDVLETALENDDSDSLQNIMSYGTSVDYIFSMVNENRPNILKSQPPIISFAAFYRSENCVNFLIQNGANTNLPDSEGIGIDYSVRDKSALTSIHYAAKYGNIDALKLLWVNGAASLDDTAYTLLVQSGVTPLHLGAESDNFEVVDFLIENGCNINFQTKDGLTPLHYAIKAGKINMVKHLLEKGADPSISDLFGIFFYNFFIKHVHKLRLNRVILRLLTCLLKITKEIRLHYCSIRPKMVIFLY